jgi:hypothetical protein
VVRAISIGGVQDLAASLFVAQIDLAGGRARMTASSAPGGESVFAHSQPP